MLKDKVCVIGLGYIGLPTAAFLANKGYRVHGVDIQKNIVETINKGEIHIFEPDLEKYVKQAIKIGTLSACTHPVKADVFIISVPTPFKEGNKPDIEYVISATKSIAPYVRNGNLVILESTSPVGTTNKIRETLEKEGVDTSNIYIAHCPERVLPGQIIRELEYNDRVIGGLTPNATEKASCFYKSFVKGSILKTNAKTAELCKLVENSHRDVNIAFANELSIICDKLGINVWELIDLANHHPRVNILHPGVGVGGHCIAVDPWFIVDSAPNDARLIRAAREVNIGKTEWVLEKIKSKIFEYKKGNLKSPQVALLGLTFKPNIDDLRESPALYIAKKISKDHTQVICVEPNVNPEDISKTFKLNVVGDIKDVDKIDIVFILVGHSVFSNIRGKVNEEVDIVDFAGILSERK